MIRATEHTLTVDTDCVHNVVSIDQTNPVLNADEVDQQVAEQISDDSQSKQQNDQPTSGNSPNPQLGRQKDNVLEKDARNVPQQKKFQRFATARARCNRRKRQRQLPGNS